MLNCCVSATSTDGIISTTARLRSILQTTSTGDDDNQLFALLAATQWAESRLGYPVLGPATYTETVSGFGSLNLMLSRTPIRCIIGVFDSTSTDSATSYTSSEYRVEDAEAGLLSRPDGFEWSPVVAWGLTAIVMPETRQEWMVRYIAGPNGPNGLSTESPSWPGAASGIVTNATSTGRTVSAIIERAVLLKAAEFIRAVPGGNVSAESIGDLSVTYMTAANYRSEAEELIRPLCRQA